MPDSESPCHCTALRKATRRVSQLYDIALGPSGLKTTQYAILAHVGRSEPTAVSVLANALVMDAGALAHTLKPLVRDGLVVIAADPADRRSRLVRLSRAGRSKLEDCRKLWRTAERGFDAGLGATRAKSLRDAARLLISDEFASAFRAELESAS
ncbi:MAG: MarR family winged helix-turn-helix transcriptional regulator [Steroidobacteraceae bacterium]